MLPAVLLWSPTLSIGSSHTVNGMRVVLVGPAAYVETAGVEGLVESADVVVRLNCKLSPSLQALILGNGTTSRCDVVYHSGALVNETVLGPRLANGSKTSETISAQAGLSVQTLQVYERHGVRRVVLAWTAPAIPKIKARVRAFEALERRFPRLHFDRVRGLAGREALLSTGMRALVHLISQRPSQLTVVGFDFHTGAAFRGYYQPPPGVPYEAMGTSPVHDAKFEMQVLANQLAVHPTLFVDSHLERTLRSLRFAVPTAQVVREHRRTAASRVSGGQRRVSHAQKLSTASHF